MSPGYVGVKRLAAEHPEWLPIVNACLAEAQRTGDVGFAGRWVLQALEEQHLPGVPYQGRATPRPWFPGLRMLVRYDILEHRDTVRGGRRAYYTLPDREGVQRALDELRV